METPIYREEEEEEEEEQEKEEEEEERRGKNMVKHGVSWSSIIFEKKNHETPNFVVLWTLQMLHCWPFHLITSSVALMFWNSKFPEESAGMDSKKKSYRTVWQYLFLGEHGENVPEI